MITTQCACFMPSGYLLDKAILPLLAPSLIEEVRNVEDTLEVCNPHDDYYRPSFCQQFENLNSQHDSTAISLKLIKCTSVQYLGPGLMSTCYKCKRGKKITDPLICNSILFTYLFFRVGSIRVMM